MKILYSDDDRWIIVWSEIEFYIVDVCFGIPLIADIKIYISLLYSFIWADQIALNEYWLII